MPAVFLFILHWGIIYCKEKGGKLPSKNEQKEFRELINILKHNHTNEEIKCEKVSVL
jgi:hypothetical protein